MTSDVLSFTCGVAPFAPDMLGDVVCCTGTWHKKRGKSRCSATRGPAQHGEGSSVRMSALCAGILRLSCVNSVTGSQREPAP